MHKVYNECLTFKKKIVLYIIVHNEDQLNDENRH